MSLKLVAAMFAAALLALPACKKEAVPERITFHQTYGRLNDSDVGHLVRPTPDGGYVLAASRINVNTDRRTVRLLRTTAAGDTLWLREYGQGFNVGDPFGLLVNAGGEILLVYNDHLYARMVSVAADGALLADQPLQGINLDQGRFVLPAADGGLYIGGRFAGQAGVVHRRADGEYSWGKTFGLWSERALGAVALPDGLAVLVEQADASFSVAQLAADGSVNWDVAIAASEDSSYRALCLALADDGGLLVGGEAVLNPDPDEAASPAMLWRIGPDGRLQWSKAVGSGEGLSQFSAIERMPDGSFLAAGVTGRRSNELYLVRLEADADICWQERRADLYPGVSIAHLVATNDGGAVLTGGAEPSNVAKPNILLLRVDAPCRDE